MSSTTFTPGAANTARAEDAAYAQVTWRILPFLFICYVAAYLDRVNVGFAKLQMQQSLGMSDSVYGLGAGIFFIGYFFFEVPSNFMMQRVGARYWIGPIMIVWGIVSACTLFVWDATSFYVLRFVLGVVESGFFPGVILTALDWYYDFSLNWPAMIGTRMLFPGLILLVTEAVIVWNAKHRAAPASMPAIIVKVQAKIG